MFKRKNKQQPKANKHTQPSNVEMHTIQFPTNEQELTTIFKESGDVFFNPCIYRPQSPIKITLIGCQGMVDLRFIKSFSIRTIKFIF